MRRAALCLCLLAAGACSTLPQAGTVIEATLPQAARTVLGEKSGNVIPVLWSEGDRLTVNGVTSAALTAGQAGQTFARFTFSQTLTAPCKALYPATAGSSDGPLTLPAVQTFVPGSFDAAAALLAGQSDNTESLALNHLCAYLRLRLDPAGKKLTKITLQGNAGEPLAGSFQIDYSGDSAALGTPVSEELTLTLDAPDTGGEYILALAPVLFSAGFTVTAYDDERHFMRLHTEDPVQCAAGVLLNCPAAVYVPNGTIVEGTTDDAQDAELSVSWDREHTQNWAGGYGRVHRLNDGRLMAVYERGGQGRYRISTDNAATWSAEAVAVDRTAIPVEDGTVYTNNANAEFAQLSATHPVHPGRILYATNIRPSDGRSDVYPYSIAYATSDDGAQTWSTRKVAYSSVQWTKAATKGCWEPFVLELPDGRVQIYFADETPYYSLGFGYQNISVVESSDGGDTWGPARIVAYTEKRRDGMPVLMMLGGNLYLAIEHYGAGEHLHPQIVYCSVQDNWGSPVLEASAQRFDPFFVPKDYVNLYLGAPYLIYTDDYLVLSYQSSEGSAQPKDANSVMEVAVCPRSEIRDGKFTTMRAITRPLLLDQSSQKARWNSLCDLGGNEILAVSDTGGRIVLTRGHIRGVQ